MVPGLITVEAIPPHIERTPTMGKWMVVASYTWRVLSDSGEETVLQIITNIIAKKKAKRRLVVEQVVSKHTHTLCCKRVCKPERTTRGEGTYVRVALQEIRQTATFGSSAKCMRLVCRAPPLCVSPTVTPHVCIRFGVTGYSPSPLRSHTPRMVKVHRVVNRCDVFPGNFKKPGSRRKGVVVVLAEHSRDVGKLHFQFQFSCLSPDGLAAAGRIDWWGRGLVRAKGVLFSGIHAGFWAEHNTMRDGTSWKIEFSMNFAPKRFPWRLTMLS